MRAPRVLAALAALAAVLISGVLALVATLVERDDIEADLAVRSQEALARYRVPADVVDVAGRDADHDRGRRRDGARVGVRALGEEGDRLRRPEGQQDRGDDDHRHEDGARDPGNVHGPRR